MIVTLRHEIGQDVSLPNVTADCVRQPHMKETAWKRLKESRVAAGYRSMAAFAKAVGVNESTYRSHEAPPTRTGARGLDEEYAERYARKLKRDWRWLLYGDEAMLQPLAEIELPPDIPDALFEAILRVIVEGLSSKAFARKQAAAIEIEAETLADLTNASFGKRSQQTRVTLLVRGIQAACEELLSGDGAPPLDRERLADAAEIAPALLRALALAQR